MLLSGNVDISAAESKQEKAKLSAGVKYACLNCLGLRACVCANWQAFYKTSQPGKKVLCHTNLALIQEIAIHHEIGMYSKAFCCRSNAACTPRLDMTVAEFAHWWNMHKAGQDDRLLYLKDWHFANEFPTYKAYKTPVYFQEDWLNEFYDMKQGQQQPGNGSTDDARMSADAMAEAIGKYS